VGTVIVAINPPLELDVTDVGAVEIGFPSNVKLMTWEGIKSEPFIVITVPEFPPVGDNVMAEVVCVNVSAGELVSSEADTSLEPDVPAGTMIVVKNPPFELDVTESVVAIRFPPNVKLMECNGIKSEPFIVNTVPGGPFSGAKNMDEVVWVNISLAKFVASEASTSFEPASPTGTMILAENSP